MKYIKAIILTILISAPLVLWAQGPGGDDPLDDPGVPIDGGITLLVGAAVAYGARTLKKKKEQNKNK